MQFNEIRELTVEELRKRVRAERETLFELGMKHSLGQVNNPIEIRKKRRLVAKMMTALNTKLSK